MASAASAPTIIDSFKGEWAFLSNFAPSPFWHEGLDYPTVEHAFQAMKTLDHGERREISGQPTPGKAKGRGRNVLLRPDWEIVKVGVMRTLVTAKFMSNPNLATKLLSTGDAQLIEGNNWHDRFWGVCDGEGENYLGRILMQVRTDISNVGRATNDAKGPGDLDRIVVPNLAFTVRDVKSMAEAHDVPLSVAIGRADFWGRQIADTASGLVNELLVSVVKTNQP